MRESTLSLGFGALFLLAVLAQSIVGVRALNAEAGEHGEAPMSWARYVVSSEFGAALLENWQSEYLQFALFVVATVWLVQRGSAESKPIADAGPGSDREEAVGRHAARGSPAWARAGGWRTALYGQSLLIVMSALFLASWLVQSVAGRSEHNHERAQHGAGEVSWAEYVTGAEFWERTLQNWQSEFLAVGSLAVFSIYLRQRGSTESKRVGAPHRETGN